jgi:uncharacterized repeat protein (TIGR04076 family)
LILAKFEITAEDILESGVCPFGYRIGDRFEFDVSERMVTFPNFCGWAYRGMFPILVSLKYGGNFPFGQNGKTAGITCSDSRNPVAFKISFVE